MKSRVTFDTKLIAPCGMNCGTCIAFLREKNKCYGCRIDTEDNLKTRLLCKIKNCEDLSKTSSKFCFDCGKFPCKRIKHIDRRYKTRYKTSFIENLLMIRDKGMEYFLEFESGRRACPKCSAVLSVHRENCLKCRIELN